MKGFSGITDKHTFFKYELSLIFGIFYAPGILAGFSGTAEPGPGSLMSHISVWIRGAALITVVLVTIRVLRGETFAEFGMIRFRLRHLLQACGAAAVTALLMLAPSILFGFFSNAESIKPANGSYDFPRLTAIPLLLFTAGMTGFSEELYFRSFLLTGFMKAGVGPAAAVVTGSSLFAASHLHEGPAGVAGAFVTGIFFSIVYVRSGNLHIAAAGHGLYDAAVMISSLYG